jgi:4-amino-4-deoxy-L-arabinose transferase-like glycosyltransferase
VTFFGYQSPFIIALVVIFFSFVYCHSHVRDIPVQPRSSRRGKPLAGGILWGWVLTIVGTIHLTFLPSILPHILEGFRFTGEVAISTAGTIMMAYTATAILGNYLLVSLASRLPLSRLIAIACLSAAGLQGLLYFAPTSTSSPDPDAADRHDRGRFPLVISAFAADARDHSRVSQLRALRGKRHRPLMATIHPGPFQPVDPLPGDRRPHPGHALGLPGLATAR